MKGTARRGNKEEMNESEAMNVHLKEKEEKEETCARDLFHF